MCYCTTMLLAGLFGGLLFVALVLGDWIHFTSLASPSTRYGCGVARTEERLPVAPETLDLHRFDKNGMLHLPHGVARLFQDEWRILLRPQYHLFSIGFRTAWPLKATIELKPEGDTIRMRCVKRMPWSSAVLTLAWFVVVGVGTVGFIVVFLTNGGFASLSGALMGLGITGLGLLVLAFGLVIVALAYRLEDHRLSQAYLELRTALADRPSMLGNTPSS